MMPRNAQADLPVDLEAAGGREEAERRRFERVGWREHDAAVVDAAFEGRGSGRAADREVPFEEVCFEGCGVVVWRGRVCELGGFFEDAFDCGVFGGELAGGGHGGGVVFGRVALLRDDMMWL